MYVYFIYSRELGAVKVGFSLTPRRRLAALQTAHPFPLEMLGTIAGSQQTARRLQNEWGDHRLNGEWFTYAPLHERITELLHGKGGSLATETEEEREERTKERIESFVVTPDLKAWAQANTPNANIVTVTNKWRMTVRTHRYRNANGLVEDAAASWKLAMLDAQQKEANRERNTEPVGLATKHGMRTWEDIKRERDLQKVQVPVTAGSLGPMLSVRSNG